MSNQDKSTNSKAMSRAQALVRWQWLFMLVITGYGYDRHVGER